ncbi:MAG TPA: DEAD/DEAH box helicase, partial [Gemmatimonadaceae bacterium]|nr:DEAD/DEAH box helicase [Gemmatimonadaceae bacterium]
YAGGGETDVTNGQALCPSCNARKGDTVVRSGGWPIDRPLRDWQHRAWSDYVSLGQRDFLCVATPGAGKTVFALRVAHDLIQQYGGLRVVVVTPTDHLKRQWSAAAAHLCGIQLDPDWVSGDGWESPDFDGPAVTYQAVAAAPYVFRTQAARRNTLVILDEIHHAGDSLTWGHCIRQAFEPAFRRLLLSGTPFRTDGKLIPFVTYDGDQCVADFTYSYKHALQDGVCRAVMFPRFDGEMRWWADGDVQTATFRDELSEEEASRRLRTALDPNGTWLRDVLRDADRQLTEIRAESDVSAGGLVICKDQQHAQAVANLVERITSRRPIVAVSEDRGATELIERFRSSSDRWIVAVRMVSEGVDIPRLRVGVYATNVISRLFFRQVVGRFVRKQADLDEQIAHVFIPDDDVLAQYAAQIKCERDSALAEIEQEIRERAQGADRPPPSSSFTFGSSGPAEFVGVTSDGEAITSAEMQRAEALARQCGGAARESVVLLARVLRLVGTEQEARPSESSKAAPSVADDRKSLRNIRRSKVWQFGPSLMQALGDSVSKDDAYKAINTRLKIATGADVKHSSLEQLQDGNRLLDEWTPALWAAIREGSGRQWADEWMRARSYDD